MARTANIIPAAHRVAMNNRTRVSFGRTFMDTIKAGGIHHDAGKLSAFLVAAGAATPAKIQALAEKKELTLESLSQMATVVVRTRSEDTLPKNFKISA